MRDGELLVAGRLQHVCVETATWGKTPIPDWVRDGLRRFAAPDAESAADQVRGQYTKYRGSGGRPQG